MSESKSDGTPRPDRRDFLGKLLMGGGLIASGLVGLRNVLAYIFPRVRPPKERKLLVGRVGEVEPGTAKELEIGGEILYLIHLEDQYKVFSGVCTHLGCEVYWEGYRDRFFCPCHKGQFAADGSVIAGPPPKPLNQYRVEVEDSLIFMWLEERRERGVV